MLRLYEINPRAVKKIMPQENDQSRKNLNYKSLFDAFKSVDSAEDDQIDLNQSIRYWGDQGRRNVFKLDEDTK